MPSSMSAADQLDAAFVNLKNEVRSNRLLHRGIFFFFFLGGGGVFFFVVARALGLGPGELWHDDSSSWKYCTYYSSLRSFNDVPSRIIEPPNGQQRDERN